MSRKVVLLDKDKTIAKNKTIFVARHEGLQQYCREIGLIQEDTPCYQAVTVALIRGKDVIGILPLKLACLTNTYTLIPLGLKRNFNVNELSLEDIRQYAMPHKTYKIREIKE